MHEERHVLREEKEKQPPFTRIGDGNDLTYSSNKKAIENPKPRALSLFRL